MKTTPRRRRRIMRSQSRDVERIYSREQFAAKLRRLARTVERGQAFVIRIAGETLRVPPGARASVEHERSGRRHELEFQIKWTAH